MGHPPNLIADGSHYYYYDAENRLIQVDGTLGTCSTAAACYIYDASGNRVRKTEPSGAIEYIHDLQGNVVSEYSPGGAGWTRGYVYLGGRQLAEYGDGTTYFMHGDHLGSTRLMTNLSACVVRNLDYLPFGEATGYTPSCTASDSTHKFTGKERDSESGLDNFGARYNSSQYGRFMTPDPLGGHLFDPQTLNKYSYVRNNPLSLTDPSGLDFFLQCDQTEDNSSTCQTVKNSNGYTVQGQYVNGSFVATQLKNDPNGGSGFVDQYNNQYTGNFDQNGVHFTAATGGDPMNGTFARGTPATIVSGTGDIYGGFTAKFNDSCGGTCVASGSIFGTAQQFTDLYDKLKKNPGLDALDLFHIGSTQFRGGNLSGVDAHLVDRSKTVARGYDQFHYDGSYPYSTVPGFFDHAGSAFRSIGHLITGPRELAPPDQLP